MAAPRTNASHDQNHVPTLIGVSTTDGSTPVPVEVDPTTGQMQVNASVTATIDKTGLATDTNQTNGSQKTQIVDAGGEVATVTGGKLDVNATASLAGSSLPISSATTGVGVAILDSSGNQISSFGGGTQYAEGATTSPATGTTVLGRYLAAASGTLTDGQLSAPLLDNFGQLKVVPVGTNMTNVTQFGGNNVATGTGTGGSGIPRVTVSSDSFPTTQAISAASLPLPTGASTSAKQPALGTAGTASSDVLTVQGIASMTALKVDGSATTQPVSGTVTANAGTNLNTSALALEGGGNLASIKTDVDNLNLTQGSTTSGQKGNLILGAVTTAAPTYTTAQSNPLSLTTGGALRVDASSSTQPVSGTVTVQQSTASSLKVDLSGTAANATAIKVDGSAVTQPISATALPLPTGAATSAKQPALGTAGTASADVITVQGITSMTALKVDNSGVTQPVSGTVAATQSGTWTVQPGNTANTTAWKVDGSAVTQPVSLASVPSHAVTNAGTFAVQAASAGDVASGSSDSGNPVKIGGVGRTTNPTAVTDGQRANLISDKLGKQVVVGSIRDLKVNTPTTITSSTSETTVLAQVASTFLDVYGCIVANTSATACSVAFKDSTAGTTQFTIYVPAGETRGFMLPESGAVKQGTVNNNWTATCSASVASIAVTMLAVKNI